MIAGRIHIDRRTFTRVREALREMPEEMHRRGERVFSDARPKIMRELAALEPGPPKYPILWTSARQRRAFFATDGFGSGIPHKRATPSAVTKGWEMTYARLRYRAVIEVTQTWEPAPFVIGLMDYPGWQQRFHRNTGWPTRNRLQTFMLGWRDYMSDRIMEQWLALAIMALKD